VAAVVRKALSVDDEGEDLSSDGGDVEVEDVDDGGDVDMGVESSMEIPFWGGYDPM
jgi:hypothetical protein